MCICQWLWSNMCVCTTEGECITCAFENLILISFFHMNPVLSTLKFLSFSLYFFFPPLLATTTRNLRRLLISWWICPVLLGKTSHSSFPFCSPGSLAFCMSALSALCKAKVDVAVFPLLFLSMAFSTYHYRASLFPCTWLGTYCKL